MILFDSIEEATRFWVGQFNAIPQDLIIRAYQNDWDSFREITPREDQEDDEYLDILPMWGYMWTFSELIDEEWARNNLDKFAACGFRVYECDELGIVFGIDGVGYDFYEAHWIPLYKARGLRWHKQDN